MVLLLYVFLSVHNINNYEFNFESENSNIYKPINQLFNQLLGQLNEFKLSNNHTGLLPIARIMILIRPK